MKPTILTVLSVAALMAGCANTARDEVIEAQHAMVGMPRGELLSCAGAPERQTAADGREYFTYVARRLETSPTVTFGTGFGGWGGGGWGWGGGYAAPLYGPAAYSQSCAVTFTLNNGRVERVVYGGDATGGQMLGLCWPVVGNCLSVAKRLRGLP